MNPDDLPVAVAPQAQADLDAALNDVAGELTRLRAENSLLRSQRADTVTTVTAVTARLRAVLNPESPPPAPAPSS